MGECDGISADGNPDMIENNADEEEEDDVDVDVDPDDAGNLTINQMPRCYY